MSASTLIGEYRYTYGAGNSPNRSIKFYEENKQVKARVFAKLGNRMELISELGPNQMVLEGASTTRKMQIMMDARQALKAAEYPPDQAFSAIKYERCWDVIQKLDPDGPYRITIITEIGTNPRFEEVEKLIFFDPS